MKKTVMIFALTIGMGLMLTTAVRAIHPMQFSGMVLKLSGDRYEKELMLQDWMISIESFKGAVQSAAGTEMEICSWMLDTSWENSKDRLASEPELRLEDWMLRISGRKSGTIALEDWMLDIPG